jgi:hypothetical protein
LDLLADAEVGEEDIDEEEFEVRLYFLGFKFVIVIFGVVFLFFSTFNTRFDDFVAGVGIQKVVG